VRLGGKEMGYFVNHISAGSSKQESSEGAEVVLRALIAELDLEHHAHGRGRSCVRPRCSIGWRFRSKASSGSLLSELSPP
jgi:hypothetical protein